jgi:comEA protein
MSLQAIARRFAAPALAFALLAASAAPALANDADAAPAPAGKKVVNVNQASADELARLPRVGPKLADRIVSHRGQHGPFKRVEDLMEVKGIGEKMFATLKPYVVTAGTTTLTEKVSSAKSHGKGKSAARPARGKAPAAPEAGASASR